MSRYAGFVGPSYTSESKLAAFDRTVNWYPERIESGTGTATYVLYPCPGYVTLATVPDSPGRAIFALNGVLYGLYGSSLYTISTVVALRAQGLSNVNGSVAQMLSNGDAGHQLLIRADTTLYAFDFNAPASEDVPLDPPTMPTHVIPSPVFTPSAQDPGYYGYAYTFVNSAGETTASPVLALFTNGGPIGGSVYIASILGLDISPPMTARKLYRTEAQPWLGTLEASLDGARHAPLKLLATLADNTTTFFNDTLNDSSLGADVPTVNTATVHIDALTVIPNLTSNQIAYLNGYGLSLDAARSEVSFSNPLDFTTWDPLDVFQRNDAADRWKAMIVNHNEIWLFGSETTSIYTLTEDPDIPFQPIKSAFMQVGIFAPYSACNVDGQLMWIGQGVNGAGVVYRANGYTPERVSTHAVEFALNVINNANVDALTLAEGSTYQENGHVFYELTFPTSNGVTGCTWVYDATAGLWHERGAFDGLTFAELDTRGHAQVNGPQYTLSRSSGRFYRQWYVYATGTDGLGITRLRRAPHVMQEHKGVIIDNLEIHLETGVGLVSGQGSDPQVAMRFSNNDGQTWSNTRTKSAGRLGEYSTRVDFQGLGYGRDRVIEVVVSDPVPWRLIDCFIDVRTGAS